MIKKALGLVIVCALGFTVSAQENYFSNDQVTITSNTVECHYPENGIHSEYVFLKLTNNTNEEIAVNYDLDLWYNNQKISPDVTNYTITVPANSSTEGTCESRKSGLSVYSKILDLPAKSGLTKFELNNLKINGTTIIR